ncbi:MAG: transcription antitermination factor NusB [Clostridiales Family XIII bacterium]|jgi:N utilization substance protein B|nr:transcription antitermination factor NusB [Clostridiales Family XIII bacterium]
MTLLGERKKQREKIFFYFYSVDKKTVLSVDKNDFEKLILYKSQKEYALTLLNAVEKHHDDIDDIIKKYLKNWKFERIGDIQRAILRLAIAEILYLNDIDEAVSINEAVNLTKKYSDENKAKFVNGILGKIVKNE